MENRTAKIIMVCKGQHDFGDDLNHKEAIAAYLSDECLCPIEYYTEDFINNIIFQAALDYLDSVQRPSAFIRSVYSVHDLYNNTLKNSAHNTSNFNWFKAVCGAFETEQIKTKNGEYINGFTEENTQIVCRKNKTNKHHDEVDQYYIIAETTEDNIVVDDDDEEYRYYYDEEEDWLDAAISSCEKFNEEFEEETFDESLTEMDGLNDEKCSTSDEIVHIPKDVQLGARGTGKPMAKKAKTVPPTKPSQRKRKKRKK